MVMEDVLDRCCQNADMSAITKATNDKPVAAMVIFREGKGFTSRSDPSESTSECQVGNVWRRRKEINARTTPMYLSS